MNKNQTLLEQWNAARGRSTVSPMDQLKELNGLLSADTLTLLERSLEAHQSFCKGDTRPDEVFFWYRALARALAAQIDGVAAVMRETVIRANKLGLLPLRTAVTSEDKEELHALQSYEGRTAEEPTVRRLSFLEAVEASLRWFGRITGGDGRLNKGNDLRYTYFKGFVSARNTLTHPEDLEDLMNPGPVMASVPLAALWFADEVSRALSGGRSEPKRDLKLEKKMDREVRHLLNAKEHSIFGRQAKESFYGQVREDLGRGFRFCAKVAEILGEDTLRWRGLAGRDLRDPEIALWIRCLVRSFLSQVEGTCAARAKVVQMAVEDEKFELSPSDLSLATKRTRKLSEKLHLALQVFPTLYQSRPKDYALSAGWPTFSKVLAHRDRLTHPRSVQDLNAPEEVIFEVLEAYIWFMEQLPIERY